MPFLRRTVYNTQTFQKSLLFPIFFERNLSYRLDCIIIVLIFTRFHMFSGSEVVFRVFKSRESHALGVLPPEEWKQNCRTVRDSTALSAYSY